MTPGTAKNGDAPPRDAGPISLRRFYVLLLYVLAAVWGVCQVISGQYALPFMLASLLYSSTATLWAATDSKLRARPLLPIVQLLFFLTWPIATCMYLIATRGWRGIGLWLLHAVGLMFTTCLTFYPTFLTLYYFGWFGADTGL